MFERVDCSCQGCNHAVSTRFILHPLARKLCDYEAKWKQRTGSSAELDDGCVFDLSQNPQHCCIWTSKDGVVPTFRQSSRLWVPCLQRSLCPSEAGRLMGFNGPSLRHVDNRTVGNAMSLQTVGLMILAALLSAEPLKKAN